ncbi:MAG: serine hydrolase domain-containing protein [Vulcanimicrobiaceae bacterium]
MHGLFKSFAMAAALFVATSFEARAACPAGATFNRIAFDVTTGSDDLRGDSSAVATVKLAGGGTQSFRLKSQKQAGWGNNSFHSRWFGLPGAYELPAFGQVAITLTSHNGLFETDDNWNIQKLNVTVSKSGGPPNCTVFNLGGNPLVRLTGSRPTAVFDPFSMVGSPSVAAIDGAVRDVMQGGGVQGASLAIFRGTRLIYARGYTAATLGPPPQIIKPTTYFRQASVSKLIASLAIMQLVDEGKLTLDTTMQSVLHLHRPGGGPPKDPRFSKITIRHLLEMDSGLDSTLEVSDTAIAAAVGKPLPVDVSSLETYAAGRTLAFAPGDKSQAAYNDSNFDFLAYIVAKLRHASSFAAAIRKPLLEPLDIKRIRGARVLRSRQLPGEAVYYPNPYQTAKSVMSPSQPTVELGYGDENFSLMQGGGGMSAAATDMARLLAALNLGTGNKAFSPTDVAQWLGYAYAALNDKAFSGPNAFGFYGLDALGPIPPSSSVPPYEGDKGGYLETSQNAVYFQTGGLGYVICFNGHTGHDSVWYPSFGAVIAAAASHDWGVIDLFPKYGMASFPPARSLPRLVGSQFRSGLPYIEPRRFRAGH